MSETPEIDLHELLIGKRPTLAAFDAWIGSASGELWTTARAFDVIAEHDRDGELLCAVGILLRLERLDARAQVAQARRARLTVPRGRSAHRALRALFGKRMVRGR